MEKWPKFVLIFFTTLILVSCSSQSPPSASPESQQPTVVQATPTENQDIQSTPTSTKKPQGTFKGCIYFQGKSVSSGYLTFYDESGSPSSSAGPNGQVRVTGECVTIHLPPGTYEVTARYLGDPACGDETGAGCITDRATIEITAEKAVEMNFDLKPSGGS